MELSDQDRDRIYAEEKAREIARKQLKREENGRKNKKILYWFLGIFAVIMVTLIINPPKNEPSHTSQTNASENAKEIEDMFAYTAAKLFIYERLRAPYNAEYAPISQARITVNKKKTRYEVTSYVDAQNLLGAKIRTLYTVKMKYDSLIFKNGDYPWTLLDLKTDP
ncbi:MAG: hypothetical protein ABSA44_03670 [Bacteroidota bacterium]|jgi:hypothetical protein